MRNNLVIKILHGHRADVSQLLKNLKCSGRILILDNDPEHGEDLVDDLAGDEAAHVDIHILEEGHAQQRYPGLNGCQNITMTRQSVIPPLGFSSWQLGFHILKTKAWS